MSKTPLTSRQNEVLQFIKTFTRSHGYAPSVREIGKAMGITSVNAVTGHLIAMQKKGWITRPDKSLGLSRAIVVIEPERNDEDLHAAIHMLEALRPSKDGHISRVVALLRRYAYGGDVQSTEAMT